MRICQIQQYNRFIPRQYLAQKLSGQFTVSITHMESNNSEYFKTGYEDMKMRNMLKEKNTCERRERLTFYLTFFKHY